MGYQPLHHYLLSITSICLIFNFYLIINSLKKDDSNFTLNTRGCLIRNHVSNDDYI